MVTNTIIRMYHGIFTMFIIYFEFLNNKHGKYGSNSRTSVSSKLNLSWQSQWGWTTIHFMGPLHLR